MVKTKTKLVKILTLLFLILFPFGQLLRSEVILFGTSVSIHPIDATVGLIFLILISGQFKKPPFYKSMTAFLTVCVFSLIFSTTLFGLGGVIKGIFYLIRLTSYLFFFVALFNVIKGKEAKDTIYNLLIAVSAISGIFGWIQYFRFPDLRSLFYIGWDDHLYRLIGTFLDPGFTSIILVFGFILSLARYLEEKKKRFLALLIFFLVTVVFTYARAAYLALLGATYLISKVKKNWRVLLTVFLASSLIILVLPRPEGYGVKLERTHSIYAKLVNYWETLTVIQKAPLFGVGFNNMCVAREKFLGDKSTTSHACGGSDSSLLLLLATTGVLGTLAAIKFGYELLKGLRRDPYHLAFLGCCLALIIHSFFVNSLFYPWTMGFMAILWGIKE